MSNPITVTICPEPTRVRILATQSGDDILKAVLAAPGGLHPRAAATFLEGLSLWYQQTLSVVLCVDDGAAFYAMGLCDSLGFGPRQLHYDLDITSRVRARPRRTIAGLGDFRDLRQMSLAAEWSR